MLISPTIIYIYVCRTDDTDQLILILETLLEKKKADPVLYAHKLKQYDIFKKEFMCLDFKIKKFK